MLIAAYIGADEHEYSDISDEARGIGDEVMEFFHRRGYMGIYFNFSYSLQYSGKDCKGIISKHRCSVF